MKKVFILLVTLVSLMVPRAAHAQDTSEHIETYDSHVVIQKDGTIAVTETIDYFFESAKHGIYRDIPVIKTNDNGKKYEMTLTDVSVKDDQGKPYNYTESRNGDNEELKIGDANQTITGAHEYVISYDVAGALTYFTDHDELYWNSIGDQWTVPITKAATTVTLPETIPEANLQVSCFVGAQGATGTDCSMSKVGTDVVVEVDRALDAGEGATVVVGFPKGIVAVLNPKEVVPFFATLAGKVTLVLLAIFGLLWYIVTPILVIRKWWVSGRDPKPTMGEVSAWFSPPKTKDLRELTPAETGTLVDESADFKDIYASIVDLARRGYMKIIETSAKGRSAFGGKTIQYDFQKQKEWDAKADKTIQPFETTLLDAIFEDAKADRVSLKDLDLQITFETVKKQLYASLVEGGFFAENPQSVRTKYYVLAVFAFITGNLILFLVALIFGKNMPRKTQAGADAAAVARSLRNFLVSQDRELAFQAKNQMMFEKLLPYAVAFGVEVIWAKRFADMALKQPNWYVSTNRGAFNAVVFSNALGRSMSTSVASFIASKSSNGFSSGFGGGGFSGGGGGGGGGGSW